MFCPTCQTVLREAPELCPACGETMRPIAASDAVEVVEGTAESGVYTAVRLDEVSGIDDVPAQSFALVAPSRQPALPVLARLPELTAQVWRQPAVRAAVKTGASAIALSLAVRAARVALSGRGPRRALTSTALPALSDLLAPRESALPSQRAQYGEVVETYIYMRRVIRR